MKKSRLHGALEDAREGAARMIGAGDSGSNNGSLGREKSCCNPETTASTDSDVEHPCTLQTVYSRVKDRCSDSKELATLTDAQMPMAVQAVNQVVSQMREASADVYGCPALLLALEGASTISLAVSEPQQAGDQPSKDARDWYVLGKLVGRGTFGRVYHGHHRLSGSRVAIKTYARREGSKVCSSATASSTNGSRRSRGQDHTQQRPSDGLEWKRVRQEAKVMERLQPHPNVVRYFESFESTTRFDLVMELVDGCDLCDHLMQQPSHKLCERSARRIFSALCSAVASIHSQGIVHRDLKLENVLLEAQQEGGRRPVLIDFGFSELERDMSLSIATAPLAVTEIDKHFCGTPEYMAPEILVGQQSSGKAADVWSLGVILYVMLCGKFPFQGANLKLLHQSARNPRHISFPKSVSPGSQAVVRAILVADPARRPTASQILAHEWFSIPIRPVRTTPPTVSLTLVDTSTLQAFANWKSGREMIIDVLADMYGIDRAIISSTPRDQRADHVVAFVGVAMAAAGLIFLSLVHTQLSSSGGESSKISPQDTSNLEKRQGAGLQTPRSQIDASNGSVKPRSSHRQQLEQLIGLVKHSLRV